MKSIILALIIVTIFEFIGLFGLSEATDYCAKDLCPEGTTHINCKNSGGFGKLCPKDVKLLKIDNTTINAILKFHNDRRNAVASGKVSGKSGNLRQAARMSTFVWDDELAFLAELKVKRCEFEHDRCRNTAKFPKAGQNLAQSITDYDEDLLSLDNILDLLNEWWLEKDYITMDLIDLYPDNFDHPIGHFAAMMQDNGVALGCACASYIDKEDGSNTALCACNYGMTNISDRSVYKAGEATSKCKTGPNPEYPYLCSIKEKY